MRLCLRPLFSSLLASVTGHRSHTHTNSLPLTGGGVITDCHLSPVTLVLATCWEDRFCIYYLLKTYFQQNRSLSLSDLLPLLLFNPPMSLANRLTSKLVAREIARASLTLQQARAHHPDPFNPQTTRGWKAALKVSN